MIVIGVVGLILAAGCSSASGGEQPSVKLTLAPVPTADPICEVVPTLPAFAPVDKNHKDTHLVASATITCPGYVKITDLQVGLARKVGDEWLPADPEADGPTDEPRQPGAKPERTATARLRCHASAKEEVWLTYAIATVSLPDRNRTFIALSKEFRGAC